MIRVLRAIWLIILLVDRTGTEVACSGFEAFEAFEASPFLLLEAACFAREGPSREGPSWAAWHAEVSCFARDWGPREKVVVGPDSAANRDRTGRN